MSYIQLLRSWNMRHPTIKAFSDELVDDYGDVDFIAFSFHS